MLSPEELKNIFKYNPETGSFSWRKVTSIRNTEDKEAGYVNLKGYRVVNFKCKSYLVHRLVWYMEYGYFPENCVDHINGIKTDNRLINLREISNSCNLKNSGNWSHNTSGVKGVYKKGNNGWVVAIKSDGITIRSERFLDFVEAVAYRLALEECLGWNTCRDISPAKSYIIDYVNNKK